MNNRILHPDIHAGKLKRPENPPASEPSRSPFAPWTLCVRKRYESYLRFSASHLDAILRKALNSA